jgi:broad specificity phosphatase PhoE
MKPESTILTIVRHGQTSANIDRVWHGSTDTPLTDHGARQAAAAARWIETHHTPIAGVYASPLERAHHTARSIGDPLGLTPELDPDLAEYDLGNWEGELFATLHQDRKLFEHMKRDPHYRPHGGESPKQVGDRLAAALWRIADRHPAERVVVVSHGGALSIALSLLLDGDYRNWNRMMSNCAITELVLEPDAELLSFNQTDHLPEETASDD